MSEEQEKYKTRKQTIFRTVKNAENPFVMIDRRPIENESLTWKAKGILTYLLSRPDNWIVRLRDLVKRSPDGVHAVRSALKELKAAGHLSTKEVRDENGQFLRYELEVYELPFTSSPLTGFPHADNPLADNLNINDTDSTDTDFTDILRAANKKVDAILEQERLAQEAKNSSKSWTQRTKFSFNEHVLALADKAVQIFGEPSKKDVTLWVMEIGSWVDAGARVEDWKRAREIVAGYSQPVISITGMTKAIKFAAQERKNGTAPEEAREPYHPEYEKVVFDPEQEKKYVPNPNLRRFQS